MRILLFPLTLLMPFTPSLSQDNGKDWRRVDGIVRGEPEAPAQCAAAGVTSRTDATPPHGQWTIGDSCASSPIDFAKPGFTSSLYGECRVTGHERRACSAVVYLNCAAKDGKRRDLQWQILAPDQQMSPLVVSDAPQQFPKSLEMSFIMRCSAPSEKGR